MDFDLTKLPIDIAKLRSSITPKTVQQLFETIIQIWPPDSDARAVLQRSIDTVSGLYIGNYTPDSLIRSVNRQILYADKIILIDPFIYPIYLKPEYNPLENPGEHQADTYHWLLFWARLYPFVYLDLVNFARTQGDFDPKLNLESIRAQQAKFEGNADLNKLLDEEAITLSRMTGDDSYNSMARNFIPTDYLAKKITEEYPSLDLDDMKNTIRRIREENPYFFEPVRDGKQPLKQMMHSSSGSSYDLAVRLAVGTRLYLATDMRVRWKEIELDREESNVDDTGWSPFAKAFGNLGLKYLESTTLEHALRLRKENRLEDLRLFLRRIFEIATGDDSFDEKNAVLLAAELQEKVREAQHEWKMIDIDLLKWTGAETIVGLAAGIPILQTGHAEFFAAGVAAAAAINVGVSQLKRRGIRKTLPAAFFMELEREHRSKSKL